MHGTELSEEAKAEIKKYAVGEQSAEATGYLLREAGMTLPGEPDPRAGDVIVWSKQLGYGLPTISDEEVEAEVEAAMRFLGVKSKG
jgi:hypothetical protein